MGPPERKSSSSEGRGAARFWSFLAHSGRFFALLRVRVTVRWGGHTLAKRLDKQNAELEAYRAKLADQKAEIELYKKSLLGARAEASAKNARALDRAAAATAGPLDLAAAATAAE